MILRELRLERFGHFADAALPLAPGLTLLYGPNEAGKSTLLEALRIFLFGFPRGQHFDFRFPSESLAVAGTLAFADGAVAELRREKKKSGLKGKLGELALTEELLRARLGRPSEPLYSTVFAFSLDDLARGGDALRDEGLRAALAGAGVGAVKSPHAVIDALRKQAEELFTAKGRSGKAITGALGDIKDARKVLSDAQVRGDEYRARVNERDAARLEAARLGDERKRLLTRAEEAASLLRALPRRDELRGAEAERRALLPPPGLLPNAGQEYARSRDERTRLTERARELADKLERTRRDAALIVVDEALLAAAARVRPLHEQLGRYLQDSDELAELTASLRGRRSELSRQLGELRPGWTPDELDVLPHPLFTNVLERLREDWSAQRQQARELAELTARQAQLAGERERLRRRLDPPWSYDDARALLPVPRAEEVKQQRATMAKLDKTLAELARDEERLRTDARDLESKRARLDAGGPVPSSEELTRLRATRDAAWTALRATLDDDSARLTRGPLADTFAAAAAAADAHADELRRRSEDVAARAELTLRLHEVDRARADRAAATATATAERARIEAAWHALWSRCGFLPQSPDTMLEWLGDHATLRDLDAELERVEARLGTLKTAQDDYRQRLQQVMTTLKLEVSELAAQKRVVDLIVELREKLDLLRRDDERLRKLQASVRAFADDVRQLCQETLPSLDSSDAAAAMRALDERLRAATTARQRRDELARSERELGDEQARAETRRADVEATLAAWRRRAQLDVDDDDAFARAAAAARRADELDREIERLVRAVAEARGGMAAPAFAAALETAERALVDDELARLRLDVERAEQQFVLANQRLGVADAQLAQLDGGAKAAELTMGLESRRAELRGFVDEYAVVTLARALLEKQVARFQERHQPQLLGELSSLFAALTEGRYTRVYQRLDDDSTFVAVRADGAEVTPRAMSTGTREQLYLAVRLAYVRHYCAASEPLPLVLDDVLVNFDADRARATLRVLADFATRTQVLMLTCHAHLAALAADVAGVTPLPLPARA